MHNLQLFSSRDVHTLSALVFFFACWIIACAEEHLRAHIRENVLIMSEQLDEKGIGTKQHHKTPILDACSQPVARSVSEKIHYSSLQYLGFIIS